MKFKTFLILALMLAASATPRIYDLKQVVIPKYIIKSRPDGSSAVYDARHIVVPKYIIRDNKVYPSGKPVLPLYQLNKGEVK